MGDYMDARGISAMQIQSHELHMIPKNVNYKCLKKNMLRNIVTQDI
jgi:hypothetical protein